MPKRDQHYMDGQRQAIARATLDVLLEKGVYATSLRDICRAAGISIGALYTHFRTKEEAVVAACAIDHAPFDAQPVPASFDDYVGMFFGAERLRANTFLAKRFRLSLQFVAELIQLDANPPGLATIYLNYREAVAKALSALKEAGAITLPFGLPDTVEMHMQIFAGAEYQLASDRDLDPALVERGLRRSLSVTAGLHEPFPA